MTDDIETFDFGDFIKKKKIGKGGFGEVWLASSIAFGDVALKKASASSSPEVLNEFYKETRILKSLNTPYIIRYYGTTQDKDSIWIIMEYAAKNSLYHHIQSCKQSGYNSSFPWSDRFRISNEIARGLFAIHSKNIIHRDMKSLNVLLTSTLQAKITDFGLSKIRSINSATTAIHGNNVGTLLWKSPESFSTKYKPVTSLDIYSLGIIFWEIATGDIPFEGHDYDTIMLSVRNGERPDIPDDCPEPYARIIEKCWAHDPNQRPTAKEVITMLNQLSSFNEQEDTNFTFLDKSPSTGSSRNVTMNSNPSSIFMVSNNSNRLVTNDNDVQFIQSNSNNRIVTQITPNNFSQGSTSNLGFKDLYEKGLEYYQKGLDELCLELFLQLPTSHKNYFRSRLKLYKISLKYENYENSDFKKVIVQNLAWFLDEINQESDDSFNDLGDIYRIGLGVSVDNQKAFNYYLKSAENNNPIGLLSVGYCYENGIGIKKDEKEAVEYYRESSQRGNANALRNLGLCYKYGIGVNINNKKSINYFKEAAEMGHTVSQYNLAWIYHKGEGVDTDIDLALQWYKKCVDKGVPGVKKLIKEIEKVTDEFIEP